MNFEELAQKRYAVKIFDTNKKISEENINYIIEMARLAPTSYGLQAFKIKIISDEEIKQQLQKASWNQEQISSCSHLLVFCADTALHERIEEYGDVMTRTGMPDEKKEAFKNMLKEFAESKTPEEITAWASKQTYIVAAHTMLAAVEKGFNSCPMEGFDPKAYAQILQLPKNLVPSLIVPLGYPADTQRPKMRFSKEQILA